MESRFNVIFTGRLRPDVTAPEAIRALVDTFKLPMGVATTLIERGAGKVVKANVDQATAERFSTALRQAGLLIQVAPTPGNPADPPAAVAANQAMPPRPAPQTAPVQATRPPLTLQPIMERCPACGQLAVEQGQCRACGVVAQHHLARIAAQQRAFADVLAASEAGSSPGPAMHAFAPMNAVAGGRSGGAWPPARPRGASEDISLRDVLRILTFGLLGLVLLASIVSALVIDKTTPRVTAVPTPPRPTYVRPDAAPNGQPWPRGADYVSGYPQLNTNGYASVTVDNSRGTSDAFVKLYSLGTRERAARVFFIPAHRQFTATGVAPGKYDIRFRDLSNGRLARSVPFELTETHDADGGVGYQTYRLTLYSVPNGNTRTYPLAEADFQ